MKQKLFWFESPYYLGGTQVNPYYWYWHDYRCRLEPWTYEWRRYVKKWWWVVIIKASLITGLVLWLLLFPPITLPFWAKITILVSWIIIVAFYTWLLLHLGGFAKKIFGGR